MKRLYLCLAGLAGFALMLGGCSTMSAATGSMASMAGAKVEKKTLQPSDIDEDFEFLDKDNPFAKKETKVKYAKTGKGKYDKFFMRTARFEGKMVLANKFLTHLNKLLEGGFVKDVMSGKTLGMLASEGASLSAAQKSKITAMMMSGKTDRIGSVADSISSSKIKSVKKKLYKEHPNFEFVAKTYGAIQTMMSPDKLKSQTQKLVKSAKNLASAAQKDFSKNKAQAAMVGKELTSTADRLKGMSSKATKMVGKFKETMTSFKKALEQAAGGSKSKKM